MTTAAIGGLREDARAFAAALRMVVARLDARTLLLSVMVVLIVGGVSRFESGVFDAVEWRKYDRYPFIGPLAVLISMVPAVFLADALVAQGARAFRTYATCAALGATIASALQYGMRLALGVQLVPFEADPLKAAMQPVYTASFYLIYGGATTIAYAYLRSARTTNEGRRHAEIARADVRRNALELRLQSSQARIDPTLLFETLASVRALYEEDAQRADRLLDNLIAYLRAALPRASDRRTTFEQELRLIRAYLEIVTTRPDGRFAVGFEVGFDVADAANEAPMPPMLLLPLVQYLLAAPDGKPTNCATLSVVARTADRRLFVTLSSDRRALLPGLPDELTGRLAALFDENFRLSMRTSVDQGAEIRLEVPLVVADRDRR